MIRLPRLWSRTHGLLKSTVPVAGGKGLGASPRQTQRGRHSESAVEQPLLARTPLSQLEIPSDSVKLQGRNCLPGSSSSSFPRYLLGPTEDFPLGYTAINRQDFTISEWSAACRRCIDEDLIKHGSLHFRGLPISSVEEFGEFFTCLGYEPLNIVGIVGYRTRLKHHVFTASDDPKQYSIELHTESSHMHRFPTKFVMFCAREPAEGAGGETALAKLDDVTRNLDPGLLGKFRQKQVRYIGRLPDENKEDKRAQPWQDRFMTKDRREAEAHFKSLNISYEWLECGSLKYWYTLPAFRPHPDTGRLVWFNQALSHHASYLKVHPNFADLDIPDDHYPFHTCYGDGTEFEPAELQHIRDVSWACARGFRWKTGDVIVLDNFSVMHSRMSFTGERKMVTSLTAN